MALRSRYALELMHPLIDVTVTTIAAGKTHITTSTGNQKADSAGVSQTTQIGATLANASNQTTQSGGVAAIESLQLSGTYGDGCRLYVVSPIDSGGVAVDCEIRPVVDGVPFRDHFNVTAGVNDNMFPIPGSTVGAQRVDIGVPYRKAARARMTNLPLKATGWKYKSRLQFEVYSDIGFGVSAAPTTPLRILVLGDKVDDSELAIFDAELQDLIAAGYDPFGFVDKVQGFPAYSGTHALPGGHVKSSTWTSLPNGPAQVGTTAQVYRFMRQGYNNVATSANDVFFLSNQDSVGGKSDNVAQDFNDLGFDYTSSSNYLRLDLFSHRAGANQAFVGVRIDDTYLPTPKGIAATSGVNLFPGGEVQPIRSDSNLYFPIGRSPFPVAVNKNKVVFFVTPNGTAIAAEFSGTPSLQDASQVGVGGIEVIGGDTATNA